MSCADCGNAIWRSSTSLPEGQARCRPCRRAAPSYRNRAAMRWIYIRTCACGVVFSTRAQSAKRCRPCARKRSNWRTASRGGTQEAGYGQAHRLERRRRVQTHEPTDPCVRCGQPLGPMSRSLHLDHDDEDRTKYLGFAHASCNVQAASAKAHGRRRQIAGPRTPEPVQPCPVCGATPRDGRTRCCSRACAAELRRINAPVREPGPRVSRSCATCGAQTHRPKYCSETCSYEAFRISVRNRYRQQHGIPLDAPKYESRRVYDHGTDTMYRHGCRCEMCRSAHNAKARERRRRKESPLASFLSTTAA